MHLVMQMKVRKEETAKPLTVRIPAEQYEYLKSYAEAHGVSLNLLAAEAISEYRAKIERDRTVAAIQAHQEELREHGEGIDSVNVLREMREARASSNSGSTGKDEGAG